MTSWLVLGSIATLAILIVIVVARDALFGPGAGAIHDPGRVGDRIHVCGRDYNGGTVIRRSDWASDAPFVLVDPAPFAPCTPVVEDPAGICSSGAILCATWTIVFVRVGPDAYAEFGLVGGP